MKKTKAIQLFGKTSSDLARALEITPQAIGRWPEHLTERQTREVIGAAVRLGKMRLSKNENPEPTRQVA